MILSSPVVVLSRFYIWHFPPPSSVIPLFFLYKIHEWAEQQFSGRGPEIFGGVRVPPPPKPFLYPPHVMAQHKLSLHLSYIRLSFAKWLLVNLNTSVCLWFRQLQWKCSGITCLGNRLAVTQIIILFRSCHRDIFRLECNHKKKSQLGIWPSMSGLFFVLKVAPLQNVYWHEIRIFELPLNC